MDLAAFETRCHQHRQSVLAYAYTCSGDLHLAEDIVQEALLIALRKREHYFPDADFGAWLIAIARNVWFRERERRQISERAHRYLHDHASELFEQPAYEPVAFERERGALRGCLGRLGEQDRGLILAHFSEGLRYQQIAERLGRTLSWVKVRMFRLRAALQACVEQALGQDRAAP
jgi:RNA polymerase sigma-70 factor (ECF subfamily)